MSASEFDLDLIRRHDVVGPGYSSYPTPRHFRPFTVDEQIAAVTRSNLAQPGSAISVYVHVPFCAGPCFYCGCAKVVRGNRERAAAYVERLLREIDLQAELFHGQRVIEQLHFGGTPSALDDGQLHQILAALEQRFGFAAAERRDFSIEVDPRTVDPERIARIAAMGFNRLSIAVQDLDVTAQAAVGRAAPPPPAAELLSAARQAGIKSVAMDLIYGLPQQTPESFAAAVATVAACVPDRIAIFGYLHLAAPYKAVLALDAPEFPDAGRRLELLHAAVEVLRAAGYVHIGTDHFARPGDELAVAARENRLQRNFQGYSTRAGLDLLGLGVTAISRLGGAYVQNACHLDAWEAALDAGQRPVARGRWLSEEDQIRGAVIERILCGREVRYSILQSRFGIDFRQHFARELRLLRPAVLDRLVEIRPDRLRVTPRGRYLLRPLAMLFDAYLEPELPSAAPRAALSDVA